MLTAARAKRGRDESGDRGAFDLVFLKEVTVDPDSCLAVAQTVLDLRFQLRRRHLAAVVGAADRLECLN